MIGKKLKFITYIEAVGKFGISLVEYLFHKIDELLWLIQRATIKNIEIFLNLKFHAVSRLIWSRGRLGTNIRYIFIVMFAVFIFLSGGIFQGRLVKQSEAAQDAFLAPSQSILLEDTTAATYQGETRLLDAPSQHIVVEGETLSTIAKKYGITVESIKFANSLVYDKLKVGQELMIPPVEGTLHKVKTGDTIESLARKYRVPSQTIVDYNYIDAPYELEVGQVVTIPDAQLPEVQRFYAGTRVYDTTAYGLIPYARSGVQADGDFVWPLSGIITQGFHRYHPAIDIATNSGDIVAADKGTVVRAGWWQGGYGNAVQVDHRNGYVTTYAHLSSIAVSAGDEVGRGQKLGVVGSTGRSTGRHLHFTVQYEGAYLNPFDVL